MVKPGNGDDRLARWKRWMGEQYRDSSSLRARAALHERFGTRKESWHRWLFDHYAFPDNALVLEVGCGPGDLWDRSRDHLSGDWRILLTDLSPGMVTDACQLLEGLVQFSYAVADVQALPLADASVDAVVANQMLSHAPDPSAAVRELRRVLKATGRLYIGASGRQHMGEVTALLHEFDPALPRYEAAGTSFTLEEIEGPLSPWFTNLRIGRFESVLLVTEAEPLVAYAYSMSGLWAPRPERKDALRSFVESRLQREGAIRIRSITGIVAATPR